MRTDKYIFLWTSICNSNDHRPRPSGAHLYCYSYGQLSSINYLN